VEQRKEKKIIFAVEKKEEENQWKCVLLIISQMEIMAMMMTQIITMEIEVDRTT
jgi:hypothetical protein